MNNFFRIQEKDASEFLKKLKSIRQEALDALSHKDYEHFKDFKKKLNIFKIIAYTTAPFCPNIFSAAGFGVARVGNWITMHHISHKGYDRVPRFPEKLKSKNFAKGARRYIDWLDWMLPEAWAYEHNILHHTYTGEKKDPDVPEVLLRNYNYQVSKLTQHKFKLNIKYVKQIWFFTSIMTWRWSYYAPNTLKYMYEKEGDFKYSDESCDISFKIFLDKKLWQECYAPYFIYNFMLTPLFYFPLGPIAMLNVFINSCMGEVLANIYSFTIIGTNHAGQDLYRYSNKASNNMEKIFRQILGSVNYKTGGNWNDFFHMYLNYQIEHHIWPDLPMSAYQIIQPKVKKLCEEFGVPYIQENVFSRLKKTYSNIMGESKMKIVDSIVEQTESLNNQAVAS